MRASEIPARYFVERNLHVMALADRDRQNRTQSTQSTRVCKNLSNDTGSDAETREVRHSVRPGNGLVSGLPHAGVKELRELIASGCTVIQIEEPTIHFIACYHPEATETLEFLMEALNYELEGLESAECLSGKILNRM